LEEQQQRSTDMSMQVVSFNARVVLRPAVRAKSKRRVKEAIRLIVTRGAVVEDSRDGPQLVFRAEDVGADKWIAPGALKATVLDQGFTHTFACTQLGRIWHCQPLRCSACHFRGNLAFCVVRSIHSDSASLMSKEF
jgi:hypothetical protein